MASPIRDFFTRNLGYKLVALLLALLLWFDVTSGVVRLSHAGPGSVRSNHSRR